MRRTVVSILTLNVLSWTVCQAVPLMDLKGTLEGNVLEPVVTSACTSESGCWEWLPLQEVRQSGPLVPDDLPMPRFHIRRQIPNADRNVVLESWNENIPLSGKRTQSPPAVRQAGGRMTKKDVFVSRSWGAGGMPFSVLYMSPHGPRGNHASNTPEEAVKATEPSPSAAGNSNYRIALRNGASGQPRRHYSMIPPHIFISYGWGPFGK